LDPEVVACLLRILVRYFRAMMLINTRSLNFDCLDCYRKTVEVILVLFFDSNIQEISVSLLPSIEDVISKGFFSDGSTLVANPPKVE
jgi:hypothetical protein